MTAQILMNESVLRSNLTLPYGFASQREKASQNNKVELNAKFKRILVTKLKMNNNKHGEKVDQFNDPHKLLPKIELYILANDLSSLHWTIQNYIWIAQSTREKLHCSVIMTELF